MTALLLYFYWHRLGGIVSPSRCEREFIMVDELNDHAHYRRFSKRYRSKRRLVRTIWAFTGAILLLCPVPPLIGGAIVFSTCLSFAILDES